MQSKQLSTPFNNLPNDIISQDNYWVTKFKIRQEYFYDDENYSRKKEKIMINELSLGEKNRNIFLMKKRFKKFNLLNEENIHPLIFKLTIPREVYEKCNEMKIKISQFKEILELFLSEDLIKKYIGLVGIKKFLIFYNTKILHELNHIDIISKLFFLLENFPSEFQYQALWCLSYILLSDNKSQIICKVERSELLKIINLLDSNIEQIKSQAILLLGKLANDSSKIRKILFKEKTFDKLIIISKLTNNKKLIKLITWAISKFFRIKQKPTLDMIKKSLNLISRSIILLSNDNDFLLNTFFILSFISKYYKDEIKYLFDFDIIPIIIDNLKSNSKFIQIKCLSIIRNIIKNNNINQIQILIDLGILDYLKKTIFSRYKNIRKESLVILSHISSGIQTHKEILIEENYLPILNQVILIDQIEIKRACLLTIYYLTLVQNPSSIKKILEQGVLDIIFDILKNEEGKYLVICLEALYNLLNFGKKNKKLYLILEKVEKIGMYEVLEKLQIHPLEQVYQKNLRILENFFDIKSIF